MPMLWPWWWLFFDCSSLTATFLSIDLPGTEAFPHVISSLSSIEWVNMAGDVIPEQIFSGRSRHSKRKTRHEWGFELIAVQK